ncbi:MAG: TROVE domain-containing protein [Polyangiaceae bacterium]
MAIKSLFSSARGQKLAPANSRNEAGGLAYAFSPEHALAQYAATGTFNHTYYASGEEQLEKVLDLARNVTPEFLAKTALYSREHGLMKDMPAFLLAVLATKDTNMLARVFARVIDNGKMLRNFVQIVRSGVTGRKSFGTAPKRLVRRWFSMRTPDAIFRQSLGSDPSLQDVIKMVRPSPKLGEGETDAVREALYGYLIGKDVARDKLPTLVQTFEAYKASKVFPQEGGIVAELPNLPFEMLTAFPGDAAFWTSLAKRMSFTQLRMNLNTLSRHGVFQDDAMVAFVAEKLRDPEEVRRSRVQPFQLLSAFKAAYEEMPQAITMALQEAMETAIENVPIALGKVVLCPDVSGSMHSPVTGFRKGASSKVRCIDVAALMTATILRRNSYADVLPFSDDVVRLPRKLNPLDSVMTNAQYLASLPSGGTACSAPLRELNRRKVEADLVIYVSDNMSWRDFSEAPGKGPSFLRATVMAEEWERFRERNPRAKLVLIDVQPYGSTQMAERADVLNVGGFSDAVFDTVSLFAKGELTSEHWVSVIQNVSL